MPSALLKRISKVVFILVRRTPAMEARGTSAEVAGGMVEGMLMLTKLDISLLVCCPLIAG